MHLLNLGTYPPKQCGIASFSNDLRDNLLLCGADVSVAAISDTDYSYVYPSEVVYKIRQDRRSDYITKAKAINKDQDIKAVVIQHEYGIFGGEDGDYVLDFIYHLDKPFLLVTHTVLPHPTSHQRRVLSELVKKAAAVISMTERSADLLARVYQARPERVHVIHHGVPNFKVKDREELKKEYGLTGRRIITTFGLIGPGKGIEKGLQALAAVVERHPDVLYIIAGGTHPMLLKKQGESYREMLINLVADLGLESHVKFVNRFLEVDQLGDYLYMTDVYLSPYPNRDQAVSGTLAYAIGCGRAIVATPYEYALEMLREQRGLVAEDARPEFLARLLNQVLSDAELQAELEKAASTLGRTIKWSYTARQYMELAEQVAESHERRVV
ncbi:MAG: glycosyltransferase [Syntrophomonadaceae bacterium]|jgi:glycosyltransferase involved in cell wall biosynthesis|nr:glycosyltransferase [Syntrophomonadaceae bacterium]